VKKEARKAWLLIKSKGSHHRQSFSELSILVHHPDQPVADHRAGICNAGLLTRPGLWRPLEGFPLSAPSNPIRLRWNAN